MYPNVQISKYRKVSMRYPTLATYDRNETKRNGTKRNEPNRTRNEKNNRRAQPDPSISNTRSQACSVPELTRFHTPPLMAHGAHELSTEQLLHIDAVLQVSRAFHAI